MVLTEDKLRDAMELAENIKTKDNFDKLTEIVLSGASPEQISVIRKCTLDTQNKIRRKIILMSVFAFVSELNAGSDEQMKNSNPDFTTRKDFLKEAAELLRVKLTNMDYFELTEHFGSIL